LAPTACIPAGNCCRARDFMVVLTGNPAITAADLIL
jgi:hypothetical protein